MLDRVLQITASHLPQQTIILFWRKTPIAVSDYLVIVYSHFLEPSTSLPHESIYYESAVNQPTVPTEPIYYGDSLGQPKESSSPYYEGTLHVENNQQRQSGQFLGNSKNVKYLISRRSILLLSNACRSSTYQTQR